MSDIIDSLKKKAKCIFIAVDESVARDVAVGFHDAITEIETLRQQLAEVTEQRDGLAEALHAVYGMWGSDNPMPEAFLDASLIAKAALAQRRKEEGK
jgi:hypothetical protein